MTAAAEPSPTVTDLCAALAHLLDVYPALDDRDVNHSLFLGCIDVHVTADYGPVRLRRSHIAAVARILGATVFRVDYSDRVPDWGHLRASGTVAGVPVSVWTEVTAADARTLGWALLPCGHPDLSGEPVCLAVIDGPDGERPCGDVPLGDEPVPYVPAVPAVAEVAYADRSDWS